MSYTNSEDDDYDDDVILIKENTIQFSQHGNIVPSWSQIQNSIDNIDNNSTMGNQRCHTHQSFIQMPRRNIAHRKVSAITSSTSRTSYQDTNLQCTGTESTPFLSNPFDDLESLLDNHQSDQENDKENVQELVSQHNQGTHGTNTNQSQLTHNNTKGQKHDNNNNTMGKEESRQKHKSSNRCENKKEHRKSIPNIQVHDDIKGDRTSVSRNKRRHSSITGMINEPLSTPFSIVQNRNSIVGSRPLHWSKHNAEFRQSSSTNLSSKRNMLARAVCTSLVASNSLKRKKHQEVGSTEGNRKGRSPILIQQQVKTPSTSATKVSHRLERDSTMVFRPTALAKLITSSVKNNDTGTNTMIGDVVDSDLMITTEDDDPSFHRRFGATSNSSSVPREYTCSISSSNICNSFSISKETIPNEKHLETCNTVDADYDSPPSKSRNKLLKCGPLSQRLKYLRDRTKGNVIRFQSGQYPFDGRMTSRDVSNPRNRTSIYIDVTIQSIPRSLEEGHNDHLLVSLGFVHNVVQIRSKQQHDNLDDEHVIKSTFVWVLLTVDTIRRYNVTEGTDLRIYDFIRIPSPTSSTIHWSDTVTDNDNKSTKVTWVIACTQLCEPYPTNDLPPLPKISQCHIA